MKFIVEYLCLVVSCCFVRHARVYDGEGVLLDDLLERLPPLVVFRLFTFLPFKVLALRQVSHSYNSTVIKVYRRMVGEEFGADLRTMPIFGSWTMACVKFVDGMVEVIRLLESEGMTTNKKSGYTVKMASKMKCDKLPCFKDLSLDELLKLLISLFREKNISFPLELLLDFLNYSQIRLKQNPQLAFLQNHLKHDDFVQSRSFLISMAFKVIRVLGYEYFSEKDAGCDHWLEYDLERVRSGHGKYYSDEESVNWSSRFDDRNEVCRSSVRSFQRTLTGNV